MADNASGASRGASDYRWQGQDSGAGGEGVGARRRFWLIVLTGLLLTSLSLVIVWMLLIQPPHPPPYFLSINIAEYNDKQYPVVAFAGQDAERIHRHFPGKQAAATKTKELLRKELAGLAGRPESTVIVHISALAVSRDDKVFILPADAEVDNETQWVELREVVNAIAKCPAKNRLLILDLAHPLADARLGVLSDRVAETIEDQFARDKPPFPVLCPCSAGQMSLTSEVFEASVFAYYLDQGLQGHADLNKDLGITVKELFEFVEARVDRWAQNNRGMRQKPRRFGKANDFVVASAGKTTVAALEISAHDPYPATLLDDWKSRDDWWTKEAFRQAPRYLNKLDAVLDRQELRWRGGAIEKKQLATIDEDSKAMLADVKRAMALPATPARSLAQTGTKENQALFETVLFAFAAANDLPPGKESRAKLATIEKDLVKKLQESKGVEFPEKAWAVMEALNRVGELQPDHLRVAQGVLAQVKPQYVEMVYVQRLIAFSNRLKDNDPDTWRWPPEKIQAILATAKTHEAVIAALYREPSLLPWIGPLVDDGDKLRRSGEKKLLNDRPANWKEAYRELQSANETYKQALQWFDTLQRCRFDLDRSFAVLPFYAQLLCGGVDSEANGEAAWDKAAKVAVELQKFFADPPEIGASGAKSKWSALMLDTSARDLNRCLKELDDMLARRIVTAKRDDIAGSLDLLLSLLKSPLLKAPDRAALFGKQRELAAKLHAATDKQDQEDNRQGHVSPLPDAAPTLHQQHRGLVRAAMAIALLRMAGIDTDDKKFAIPAGDAKVSADDWTNLERTLRTAWSIDLVARWRIPPSPLSADVLNRTVSPWASGKRIGGVEKDASRILLRAQRAAFLNWLQERYQAEGRLLEAAGQEQPASAFFLDAARELRLQGSE